MLLRRPRVALGSLSLTDRRVVLNIHEKDGHWTTAQRERAERREERWRKLSQHSVKRYQTPLSITPVWSRTEECSLQTAEDWKEMLFLRRLKDDSRYLILHNPRRLCDCSSSVGSWYGNYRVERGMRCSQIHVSLCLPQCGVRCYFPYWSGWPCTTLQYLTPIWSSVKHCLCIFPETNMCLTKVQFLFYRCTLITPYSPLPKGSLPTFPAPSHVCRLNNVPEQP